MMNMLAKPYNLLLNLLDNNISSITIMKYLKFLIQ